MQMASSVARMPHDEWLFHHAKPLEFSGYHVGGFAGGVVEEAPATPRRRQILERWAPAMQVARESDDRRRAHDDELSALLLSSASQPVAARAACFLPREPSPAPSDGSSSTATAATADLPSSVRASSLIQKWREMEAVGPTTPRVGDDANSVAAASEYEDAATDASGEAAQLSPRGRVGCIVKMLSGADEAEPPRKEPTPPPPPLQLQPSRLLVRRVRGRRDLEELVARLAKARRRELAALAERHAVSQFVYKGRIQSMLRLRILRQGITVGDEPWTLRGPVWPKQSHNGGAKAAATRNDTRIIDLHDSNNRTQQTNGEDRNLKEQNNDGKGSAEERENNVIVESPVDSEVAGFCQYDVQMNTDGNRYQEDSEISVLPCNQYQEGSGFSIFSQYDQQMNIDDSQYQEGSEVSGFDQYDQQMDVDDNQYQEDVSPRGTEITLPETQSPSSRGDNLREENDSANGSWEERTLWLSNLDWRTPAESMSPSSWNRDVIGDLETYHPVRFSCRPWASDSPNSWRALSITRQADRHDISNNVEICQLLESKKVSKSLESDFSDKMNKVILSILCKQRRQNMIDDFGGYYEERFFWRQQNDESQNGDQVASASSSLVPVSRHTFPRPDSWHHHASQNFLEMEVMHDVRSEMAQIHHEINALRKLVETCIESQVKMQQSIKQEVCSAVHQAVRTGLMSTQPNPTTVKRGSCCICNEMQVDSLLYRCGHMCACFNCATELKSSCRNCPICRSPIMDVVRAQPNF